MKVFIFASGFRPTFLLAGIAALTLIPVWVAVWAFGVSLGSSWPPTLWHAHEMLFGFIGAAIAGFMLTAVPSWTGRRGFAGAPLILLSVLWLAGRLMILSARHFPAALVLGVDVSFLLFLAVLLAPPLVRARNRNALLLVILIALAGCNVGFHAALMRHDVNVASHILYCAVDIVLLMVTVIGGRILPAFTSSGLRANGTKVTLRTWPLMTGLSIAAMAQVLLVDIFYPNSTGAGTIAGLAAVIQMLRLLQWRSQSTLRLPILWILHIGYVWLPVGLALKCAALLGGPAFSAFWLHALTVGALATMIMGVMSRAALGHTGRPLEAAPLTVTAYVLLSFAAAVRVFGLSAGLSYPIVIVLSASFFTVAFGCFLFSYGPILWSPRVDGKAG
jgi:uncharacterized protein involved in response to NO